jgi:putative ABC transport system permease protein
MGMSFWLRWSWRDLRGRLLQVVAIAAIIALGSGIYAGLGSTSAWRQQSLDASFAGLAAHDIEVSPVAGFFVPQDQLLGAVRSAGGQGLSTVEARLVADLPVRAGRGGQIPAAGVVVGVDLAQPVEIDRWKVTAGRSLGPGDAQGSSVLLDEHFADAHHLPPTGTIVIAGTPVRYVGTVLEPEYLNTTTTFGTTIQGAATRAVIFAPIGLVQRLADQPGQANDVVARVRSGESIDHVAATLTHNLPITLPNVAMTVAVRNDDPMTLALYDEIISEQKIFDVFALLILAGAGFAAFNLTRRVVEAQRRDIGIAMALGVSPGEIAIRPIILAAEVAVAGVALGVLAGWGIGIWVLGIFRSEVPLPIWHTPWQGGLFLRAAVLGLVIPLAGSAYPVWRAVRVAPTDALLPPHLRSGRHRGSGLLRKLPLPGSTMAQAPVRRITIAPTRSAMTVLAIGLILAPLLAALGTTDSASATIDAGTQILSGNSADQLLVSLTNYQPSTAPAVSALVDSPLVAKYALGLNTGGYLLRGHTTVAVSISMVDLSDPLVAPTAVARQKIAPGGIVIATKAAADLGVGLGGDIVLRHPLAQGSGYRFVDTVVPIRAIVDSPYRFVAYMDLRDEPMMGLSGIVNTATLVPRPGVSINALQRRISLQPGVAWALPASTLANTIRDILGLVTGLFVVLQIVIGMLAFLVAYNSTKIGSDERAREHATMMAFGVGVPRVVLIGVIESVLLGVIGIGVGLGVGLLVLHWVLGTVFPAAVPELSVLPAVAASSFVITVVIGLVATASAPTLVARQLERMNLPSTLRYVE